MAKAKVGAKVKFCNHDGWFIADIYEVAEANVVRANRPISPESLQRSSNEATHHLLDFPKLGFFRGDLGIFVVPKEQVIELETSK